MRRKEEGYVPPGYRLPTAQLPASAVPGTKCQYLERGKSLTFQLLQNFPTNRRKITRELVIISCYFHGKFHRPPRVTTSSYTPPTPNLSLSFPPLFASLPLPLPSFPCHGIRYIAEDRRTFALRFRYDRGDATFCHRLLTISLPLRGTSVRRTWGGEAEEEGR